MSEEIVEQLSFHDRFFRKMMENPRLIREFFEKNLPQEVRAAVDLDSIQPVKDSFLRDTLRQQVVDLLFSARFQGKDGFLLLIEHASTPQRLAPLRLLHYMITILEKASAAKDDPEKNTRKKLPLIYPLLFYTGKKKYTYSTDLFDLFDHKELAKKLLTSPYPLVDVNRLSEKDLQDAPWYDVVVHCMRDNLSPHFPEIFRDELKKLDAIATEEESVYIKTTLTYAAAVGNFPDEEVFQETVRDGLTRNPMTEEELMTYGQQLITQGFKKGKLEGKIEGKLEGKIEGKFEGKIEEKLEIAFKLIDDGVPLKQVAHWTGLSLPQLKKLLNQKSH